MRTNVLLFPEPDSLPYLRPQFQEVLGIQYRSPTGGPSGGPSILYVAISSNGSLTPPPSGLLVGEYFLVGRTLLVRSFPLLLLFNAIRRLTSPYPQNADARGSSSGTLVQRPNQRYTPDVDDRSSRVYLVGVTRTSRGVQFRLPALFRQPADWWPISSVPFVPPQADPVVYQMSDLVSTYPFFSVRCKRR